MQIFKGLFNAFYPNTCISCGEIIEDGEFLCDSCYEMLPEIDYTKNCNRCGIPKKDCQCKSRVFYFGGTAAPFYNDTSAKSGMYKFKFSRNTRNAEFFSQRMALTVNNVFKDIKFDYITYVPLTAKKYLFRGFNQSRILAKQIGDLLCIPFADKLLYRNKGNINQHDIKNPKERFINVVGLYYCKQKVTGKNILLVDDIKTTGATLNECAKQLLINGANNVYCITGLISYNRKENKNGN